MKALKFLFGLVVVAAIGVAAYLWWQGQNPPPPPEPVVQAPAPAPVEAPAPPPAPAIEHPIEAVAPPPPETAPAAPAALPAIEDSDSLMVQGLKKVLRPEWLQWLNLDGLVRRFVATVDNLPRQKLARRVSPFKPVAGSFLAMDGGVGKFVGAENSARYLPYVVALENVDLKALVSVYRAYYPLFQKAYRELGYPDGYFNDRLVAVIDHLLATPQVQEPIRVVQPKVLYEFADPGLESLSAGQKIMLRMGADNAARVKQRLQVLRGLLTGGK